MAVIEELRVGSCKVSNHRPRGYHVAVAAASSPAFGKAGSGPCPIGMPSAVLQLRQDNSRSGGEAIVSIRSNGYSPSIRESAHVRVNLCQASAELHGFG